MIKFFHKIRQGLLFENKLSKYFFYGFGEIILVVIGILIAISIDNWNSERLDRVSEVDYLKRLSADLANDSRNYQWTVNALIEKQEALGRLLARIKSRELTLLDSMDILKTVWEGRFLSFAHPRPVTGIFEELKNTGSFKQIESKALRSAISKYYFMRGHHYYRIEQKRMKPSFGDEIDRIIPGIKSTDGEIGYRTDLVSFSEIMEELKKPYMQKNAASEYNLAVFMLEIQESGLEDSKTILNQIRGELAALEN